MVVEVVEVKGREVRHRGRTPTRMIAVACVPRSGSTLLAGAFNATGVTGTCDEMLMTHVIYGRALRNREYLFWARLRVSNLIHRARIRKPRGDQYVGRRLVLQHLDRYVSEMMSDDGVLVAKLFWGVYRLNMLEHGLDVHHWGAPVVWIRLVRNDRLEQAVSTVRAQQSDQWLWNQTAARPVSYDGEAITRELRTIGEREQGWDDYFAQSGESPLLVMYEDLDQHYETTLRRIFDHVGLEGVPVPPPQLIRQRDDLNEEWMRRYRTEHPEWSDGNNN